MLYYIQDSIDGEEGISLHNMVGEVNSLRYLDILNIFELVTLQPEILTLMLVMVMGALGALIHVTQGYLKQETEESWAVFLFRPLLGVVSALAIYILARAGVLVVSDSGQSAGNAGLSPFFVSFLAIISGLLAESAISNIREAGKNFLKPVDTLETLRWSNGIAEEIEAQAPNKELENLVTILGLPEREVDDIVNGRIPAPEHTQTAIAAWLDKQPRQLFTDLKPS